MTTHLHVHSGYSAHFGVTMPEDLAALAREQGATALALTDRDGLYGAVKHVAACRVQGLADDLGRQVGEIAALARQVAGVVALVAAQDPHVGAHALDATTTKRVSRVNSASHVPVAGGVYTM